MVGGAGLHSRGRSSLQRPECEMEPSSFVWSGAWCSMEIVGDRAADDTHGHIVTRSNVQSGSFSNCDPEIANKNMTFPGHHAWFRNMCSPAWIENCTTLGVWLWKWRNDSRIHNTVALLA